MGKGENRQMQMLRGEGSRLAETKAERERIALSVEIQGAGHSKQRQRGER